MDSIVETAVPVALGVIAIGYVAIEKHLEYRFRRTAVEVTGRVLRAFSHRHFTSYFIAYEYGGSSRAAEYRGLPAVRSFDSGESVRILIDPRSPPDVEVPETTHDSTRTSASCSLADQPVWGVWDFVYLAGGGVLICGGLAFG